MDIMVRIIQSREIHQLMISGWLHTSTTSNAWVANQSLPATKILKELARLTGQDVSQVDKLINKDILGQYPNKDQISSFYSMVQHQDNKGKRSSPNNYIKATLNDPKKYPLTVQLNSLVTKVLFSNSSAATA